MSYYKERYLWMSHQHRWIYKSLFSAPFNQVTYVVQYGQDKTGELNPNWRKQIRAGQNATTTFLGHIRIRDFDPPHSRFTYMAPGQNPLPPLPYQLYQSDDNFIDWMNLAELGGHYVGTINSKVTNQAIAQLYRNLFRAHHQVQGGVILGEIHKTAKMMAGAATLLKGGIIKYLTKAKKIRSGPGSNKTKRVQIANTYLQAVYGWLPLVGDCRDAAKALGRLVFESDRTRFKAFAAGEQQIAQIPGAFNISDFQVFSNELQTYRYEVIYRGFLKAMPYTAANPPLERIISMSGFDFRSFVPTMWELTPWSFLVDYFTNIGDCLYALSCDTSVVSGLTVTTRQSSIRRQTFSPNDRYTYANANATGLLYPNITSKAGYGQVQLLTVSRSVAQMPLLLPSFTGLDLPWRQFVNIGALITART